MESDFKDNLADVMKDSVTGFVVEDELKEDDKDEVKKLIPPFKTQIKLYPQLYMTQLKMTTLTFKMKKSMSPVIMWTVLLKVKEVHLTKSASI